jgi:hypothetical protein
LIERITNFEIVVVVVVVGSGRFEILMNNHKNVQLFAK